MADLCSGVIVPFRRAKRCPLAGPDCLAVGHALLAIGRCLAAHPYAENSDYLLQQHFNAVKTLKMGISRCAPRSRNQSFTPAELDAMLDRLDTVLEICRRCRGTGHAINACKKLRCQLVTLRSRYKHIAPDRQRSTPPVFTAALLLAACLCKTLSKIE
jgi:hypothetical protein